MSLYGKSGLPLSAKVGERRAASQLNQQNKRLGAHGAHADDVAEPAAKRLKLEPTPQLEANVKKALETGVDLTFGALAPSEQRLFAAGRKQFGEFWRKRKSRYSQKEARAQREAADGGASGARGGAAPAAAVAREQAAPQAQAERQPGPSSEQPAAAPTPLAPAPAQALAQALPQLAPPPAKASPPVDTSRRWSNPDPKRLADIMSSLAGMFSSEWAAQSQQNDVQTTQRDSGATTPCGSGATTPRDGGGKGATRAPVCTPPEASRAGGASQADATPSSSGARSAQGRAPAHGAQHTQLVQQGLLSPHQDRTLFNIFKVTQGKLRKNDTRQICFVLHVQPGEVGHFFRAGKEKCKRIAEADALARAAAPMDTT